MFCEPDNERHVRERNKQSRLGWTDEQGQGSLARSLSSGCTEIAI